MKANSTSCSSRKFASELKQETVVGAKNNKFKHQDVKVDDIDPTAKPVQLWNTKDVIAWMKSFQLRRNRCKCLGFVENMKTTGQDLLEAAQNGQQSFVYEITHTFEIFPIFARRMFKSLNGMTSTKFNTSK